MYAIGIDPGLNGAVVLLNEAGEIVMAHVMPNDTGKVDPHGIHDLLKQIAEKLGPQMVEAFVEDVQMVPGWPIKTGHALGKSMGFLEMTCISNKLRYRLVRAQEWQKLAHRGISKTDYTDAKARSMVAAKRLWPGRDWRASDKHKKPHDGIIDAALIAWWGLKHRGTFEQVFSETPPRDQPTFSE